ncbi:hypothetical protein BD779DRAFT_434491 [Infundibulicybe gibba]|nr:hypothetical protein BD779DRAFT_434491 [Infundibulicybe gibba]
MASSSPTIDLNCVVFGDEASEVFVVIISPRAKVSALRELILKQIETNVKAKKLMLFQFDLPWCSGLPLDKFKSMILLAMPAECLQANHRLDEIFSSSLNEDNLQIVVVPPDVAQETVVGSLERQHGALLRCLQVEVSSFGAWRGTDVHHNLRGGRIITPDGPRPEKMAEFEGDLSQKRAYIQPIGNENESLELRRAREQYPGYFSLIFKEKNLMDVDISSAPVAIDTSSDASDREFATFFDILRYHCGDSAHIKTDESSALKANYLAVPFMLPPFYSHPSPILYQV